MGTLLLLGGAVALWAAAKKKPVAPPVSGPSPGPTPVPVARPNPFISAIGSSTGLPQTRTMPSPIRETAPINPRVLMQGTYEES